MLNAEPFLMRFWSTFNFFFLDDKKTRKFDSALREMRWKWLHILLSKKRGFFVL